VVQLSGTDGYADVVTTQADADIRWPWFVAWMPRANSTGTSSAVYVVRCSSTTGSPAGSSSSSSSSGVGIRARNVSVMWSGSKPCMVSTTTSLGLILPKIGELRAHEIAASPVVLDRVCQSTRDEMSASSAKIVKTVIGNVCQFGVRVGAFETNPARNIGRIESKKAKHRPQKARALTKDEVFQLFGKLDVDEDACAADLPDLVRLFLATGERTGEALAADWADFDQDARQLTMAGNVIRATGKGKILNRGKTENSVRPIPLPDWCVIMLDNRHATLGRPVSGPIFPSSTGTVREASNVRNRAWNPFKARAGFEWVTFRTFRKTVATLLDEAGLTARKIADILGHARPSMTQDVYMGRQTANRDGADALHAVLGTEPQ
jgi:integrase